MTRPDRKPRKSKSRRKADKPALPPGTEITTTVLRVPIRRFVINVPVIIAGRKK
jgi:hypothetical protein